MKRITGLLTLSAISAVIFFACKKDLSHSNTGNSSSDGALQLSESVVSKNQPLQASFTKASDASWQVSPSDGVEIDAEGNEATFMFALPGSYTITATGSVGATASQAFVTVSNQRFNLADSSGGDTSHIDSSKVVPLTGDQITLKPVSANDSGLVLFAVTTKRYQCRNNMLLANTSVSSGGTDSTGGWDSTHVGHDTLSTQIAFTGVYVPGPSDCVNGMVRSKTFIYLPNYPLGTSPFSIVLNGKTYTGSITTTATYYQFNWSYTSGVVISPKKIARK